jgi:chromosome partitioning protein
MKGGVGKTTLAMQMAMYAAFNRRVLAVDLDPQANLSQALLGVTKYVDHLSKRKPTIVQIFEGYIPSTGTTAAPVPVEVDDVILSKVRDYRDGYLDLIPSRLELSQTLRNPAGKERRLAKALAKLADRYDAIFIDCAPTDSVLTDAAYFASRHVLIPIKPEYMATVGLPLLARSLTNFKGENDDHVIDICGIAFNHSDYQVGPESRTSISDVKTFARKNGWPVFENEVRYSRSFAKAAREGATIGRTSYVRVETTLAFRALRDEFFTAIGLT